MIINDNNSTKIWVIPVEWSVYDTVEVRADTPEDALKIFNEQIDEIPLGTEPEYIDGTYKMTDDSDPIEYIRILSEERHG